MDEEGKASRLFRALGLVSPPAPHAREFRGTALALAIAAGFKASLILGYLTKSDAFAVAWFYGVVLFDLTFLALAVHWGVETFGATLGGLAILADLAALAAAFYPFEPGSATFAALATLVSFMLGAAGALLLFRNARHAEEPTSGER